MPLLEDIKLAEVQAMKDRNEVLKSTLRMILSEVKNEKINSGKDVVDEDVQAVIRRQVKQLSDAMAEFESAGRLDLVEKNKQEIDILSKYLPTQMSDDELVALIKKIMSETGIVEQKDLGRLIGSVMKEVAGRAEGGRVREQVTKLLA